MVQWLPTSQILRNKNKMAIKGYYKSESVSPSVQLALCNPMDCNLPDSPVHGIFQARILEWTAIPFPRGSSQPRDQTSLPHCRQILYH